MKKYLQVWVITFISWCVFSTAAFAQVRGGIKAGPSLVDQAYLNAQDFFPSNAAYKLSYFLGFFSAWSFNDKVALQAELLYALKGYRGSTNTHYLSLPVLFQYRFAPRFNVEVGPEFSYLLSPSARNTYYERFDYGIALGAGYAIKENLSLGLRYTYGLYNMYDTVRGTVFGDNVKVQNRSLQLSVAFLLSGTPLF